MSFPPPVCSHLQTDGSFKTWNRNSPNSKKNLARIGFYLQTVDGNVHTNFYEIDAQTSTDTEWASILGGIKFSGEYNQDSIYVENDCLSVISFFSPHSSKCPKNGTAARHYYEEICRVSNEFAYVGLRWIPRELNRADQVLR